MTAQPPLPMTPVAPAVEVGSAVSLVEDGDGGRVFIYGVLSFAWDGGDVTGRRFAAVQLVRNGAARQVDVAGAFGVDTATLRRWGYRVVGDVGVAGLVPDRKGPRGPSRLLPDVIADIRVRREDGQSLRVIAAATGVSTDSVRRALRDRPERVDEPETPTGDADSTDDPPAGRDPVATGEQGLPLLPDPPDRGMERVAARWGGIQYAPPVFAPAGRVPLAGMFLALPGLRATGLLDCAREVFACLPAGFYGLDTMLVEGVLRCLAGQPRAEGATRIDPVAFGRILGLDRAPEVKTIRRKIGLLAATGKADQLLAGLAKQHLATRSDAAGVLYVDGHVRAYTGTRRLAKTHSPRLRFPAPATVETWVSDAHGDPVFVVLAEPAASLASELRRLLPDLRAVIGDGRRVLVGFDRGGWSPTLFADMIEAGFDVLTWRKQPAADVTGDQFTDVTFTDEHGREYAWRLADTTATLPTADGRDLVLRQVTRIRADGRQAHILTSRGDLSAGEVVYRMGSRWRQENWFRYARIHFDLDAHDTYQAGDDDPNRMVPNPARKTTHNAARAAQAKLERAQAQADADLLALHTPTGGTVKRITNAEHNQVTAPVFTAETELSTARETHRATPTRLPLSQVNPGQQVLDTQTKLITHAIRMTAFNTITSLARVITTDTGYARAGDEAHALARQALLSSGDIVPGPGSLTIRLDPMPTPRATTALTELCESLTATATHYPRTDLIVRFEAKPHH